jgi:sugar lactone lactonase YvrE
MPSLQVIPNHTSLLGEGPVWDHKKKVIIWVDIINGIIHEYAPQEKNFRSIKVQEMIGSVALCTNGNYVAALQSGFAFVNRNTGVISKIHDPEIHLPENRFNDGKCDPAGRFWAGSMSITDEAGKGNVYSFHPNNTVNKKIGGVSISNGMAWNAGATLFYYIDTPTYQIDAYDYDNVSGEISNGRPIITIDKKDGNPDGMTIDNEGMLWVAHWDGWKITRWNPETGVKLTEIAMPVARVTSCTFGGPQLQDIYITSARVGLSQNELAKQPLAGSLFVLENSGYTGVAAAEFLVHP